MPKKSVGRKYCHRYLKAVFSFDFPQKFEKPEKLEKGESQAMEQSKNGFTPKMDDTIQTEKSFSTLSALGIGYGSTNSAAGALLILSITIPLGGSPLVFWGFCLMALVGLCTAVSWRSYARPYLTRVASISGSTGLPRLIVDDFSPTLPRCWVGLLLSSWVP